MDQATAGPMHEAAAWARAPRPEPGRPVRVAMVTSMFPPSIGGIQSHTLRLAQKLVDRGAVVHVVTRVQPGLDRFERMGGVRVHRVGVAAARGPAGSAAFVADAARAVVRLAPEVDLVHAHQLLSPATVGLLSAPLTHLPLVVNPHACGAIGDVGVLSATRLGRLRLRAVLRRADAFVAVSRTIGDELVSAGAAPGAVWHIPNGVDTDRFSPATAAERRMLRRALGLEDRLPLVVYTGRLAPEKGVDVLLSAWAHLARGIAPARLCVVGAGPDEAALRQRARALGIDGCVTFAGGVPDVAPYLRAADAAVLPSRTEGLPVALLEAMSCALPVVATRVGGSAEVLEDGVTGWLVPAEDAVALAGGLATALRPGAGERVARAARADAVERWSIDGVADRFLELYRAVTPAPAGRAAMNGDVG